jgi:hypothetical protein
MMCLPTDDDDELLVSWWAYNTHMGQKYYPTTLEAFTHTIYIYIYIYVKILRLFVK